MVLKKITNDNSVKQIAHWRKTKEEDSNPNTIKDGKQNKNFHKKIKILFQNYQHQVLKLSNHE